jgi:Uma2 family endonuclease
MKSAATVERKVWTEAELEALLEDGYDRELVNGELVLTPKNSAYHAEICVRMLTALRLFAKPRKLGAIFNCSTGFWMHNQNCRGAGVSFVTRKRVQALGVTRHIRTFIPGGTGLDGEHLLPGFRYPIADLFKGWDWE